MSLVAPIKDGKVVESASANSLAQANATKNGMDKDAFLQLLVAQMKYQDPLEPTSNTEYISQYATFSQVEQMQNMGTSLELQRASGLVGQQVYVKTTNGSTGETGYIKGRVDYVVYENGKPYLSINEELYSLDDLDTVVDEQYMEAWDVAERWVYTLNRLPGINGIDLSDGDTIDKLAEDYENMTDYQKTFIAKEKKDALDAYVAKLAEVRLAAEDKPEVEDEPETEEGGDDETTE